MRRPLALLPLLVLLAGCGGSDAGSSKPAATTPAATARPALTRQEYMGVSLLVPSDWKRYKPDDKSIHGLIYGPADDQGSLGFFVTENNQSAADYIDTVILNPGNRGPKLTVRHRHKVKVPGIGTGIRMQVDNKVSDPQEQLYATSIDGLLVELTLSPGPHPDVEAQTQRIMASVRREP